MHTTNLLSIAAITFAMFFTAPSSVLARGGHGGRHGDSVYIHGYYRQNGTSVPGDFRFASGEGITDRPSVESKDTPSSFTPGDFSTPPPSLEELLLSFPNTLSTKNRVHYSSKELKYLDIATLSTSLKSLNSNDNRLLLEAGYYLCQTSDDNAFYQVVASILFPPSTVDKGLMLAAAEQLAVGARSYLCPPL